MVMLNNEYSTIEKKGEVIQLHETLEVSINEFLMGKKIYSNDTYVNYKSDLRWISRNMFGVSDYINLTKNHFETQTVKSIINFFRDVYNEGHFASSTLSRRISSLKGLIEHLVLFEDLKFDLYGLKSLLKPFPKKETSIEVLSNIDVDRCLEEFKTSYKNSEMYLLSKLAVDTGLRLNELLTLEWKQFFKDDDKVIVKSIGDIKGKGNKNWAKAISLELYNELLPLKLKNNKKVFSIPRSTVAYYMSTTLDKLELSDKNYSFHSLRKNAVTNAYISSNNDIMVAKAFANHESIDTTQKYIATRNIEVLGRFSSKSVDKDLYKKVSHEELLQSIAQLDEITITNLNRLLSKNDKNDSMNNVKTVCN